MPINTNIPSNAARIQIAHMREEDIEDALALEAIAVPALERADHAQYKRELAANDVRNYVARDLWSGKVLGLSVVRLWRKPRWEGRGEDPTSAFGKGIAVDPYVHRKRIATQLRLYTMWELAVIMGIGTFNVWTWEDGAIAREFHEKGTGLTPLGRFVPDIYQNTTTDENEEATKRWAIKFQTKLQEGDTLDQIADILDIYQWNGSQFPDFFALNRRRS